MKFSIVQSPLIDASSLERWRDKASGLLSACLEGEADYLESLGWLDIDKWAGEDALGELGELADAIRSRDEVFVLIGVGGSNNAARSVIEAVGGQAGTRVIYAGNTLSPDSMARALGEIKDKDFSINVIAKNFETIEPGIAYRFFRQQLAERYGAGASSRIIATGTPGSGFEKLAQSEGYAFLPFPTDIGGRFTSLSNVGLLPMAVAGVDIRELVSGAKGMRSILERDGEGSNAAVSYAAVRNMLHSQGRQIELLAFFEPRLKWFAKWWVQLFGESEGKDGKGIFPAYAEYSEDLHSIGQYVQDGPPVLFETFIDVESCAHSCKVPESALGDGFGYISGRELAEINRIAREATVEAHSQSLPCLRLGIDRIDAAGFGQMFYFFQFACYLSGRLLVVNPFDQPGVEAYKSRMLGSLVT